jgi:RNA polymerase sigma factor for flagellar operon FliA
MRKPKFKVIDDVERMNSPPSQIIDSSPSPEDRAIRSEREEALKKAFAGLSQREKVILRLRYEKGLTLHQIARVVKIQSPQMVDFEIQKILTRLKKVLDQK